MLFSGEAMSVFEAILLILGSLWLLNTLISFLRFTYIYLRPSSLSRYHHHSPHNSLPPWALITGATDGIGLQYANILASKNYNIILHGRNSTKLHNVRHNLLTTYPHLEFKILLHDASISNPEYDARLEKQVQELEDLHITILINNVGTGMSPSGTDLAPLLQNTTQDINALININARFPTLITRLILPHLLSHGQPSLIMTMGSLSDFGMPNVLVYSSCKAFDLAFSKGLRRELLGIACPQEIQQKYGKLAGNVEVLGIMTGQVCGCTHDDSKPSVFRPSAETFARSSLGMVGCGREVVSGWWMHGVISATTGMLPVRVWDWAIGLGMGPELERRRIEGKGVRQVVEVREVGESDALLG